MKRFLIAALLLSQFVLAGCYPLTRVTSGGGPQGVPIVDGKPPAVTMNINGEEQTGAIGTFCWPQEDGAHACADMIGMPSPEEPLVVSSPLEVRFQIPMNATPTNLSLQIFPASPENEIRDMETEGIRWWTPGQGLTHPLQLSLSPEIRLELDPGLYVFTLLTSWQEVGDAMHGFLVEVQ